MVFQDYNAQTLPCNTLDTVGQFEALLKSFGLYFHVFSWIIQSLLKSFQLLCLGYMQVEFDDLGSPILQQLFKGINNPKPLFGFVIIGKAQYLWSPTRLFVVRTVEYLNFPFRRCVLVDPP